LLSKLGLLNPEKEYAYEIGLFVGGSVNQPIHFDVAENDDNNNTYRDVMNLPNAPASLLLSLGSPARLTIQTGSTLFVENEGTAEKYCTIRGGIEDEKFKVVHETSFIDKVQKANSVTVLPRKVVTLEVQHGFVFRGDFFHSGAPIVDDAGENSKIWSEVQKLLVPIMHDRVMHNELSYRKIFNKICHVPNLHKITRLHVFIFPKDVDFEMPRDEVGY